MYNYNPFPKKFVILSFSINLWNKWIKLNKTPLYNNAMKFKRPKAAGTFSFRVASVYNGKESTYSKEVNIHVK